MPWQAWYTLLVIAALIVGLVREWARTDVLVFSALTALLLLGVVTPEQAFSGFSNPAIITIAALYVVAAGVQRTEILAFLDRLAMRQPVRLPGLLLRVLTPVAFLSAFLNNTPVVAMLIPRLQRIAERTGLPVSKLLIPLSYATIVGGMTTLIGTSTNLIASGLLHEAGYTPFGLFEFTWVGLPAAAFALLYLAFIAHRLLPSGPKPGKHAAQGARTYMFELRIPVASPLSGKTIAESDLRALEDAYLVHIQRDNRIVGLAHPEEILYPDDVLTFVGQASAMERLLLRPGLQRNVNGLSKQDAEDLPLYEAVVSAHSRLAGRTLRESGFREKYQGVVLAIHRQDEQLQGGLGTIPLKPGDLLLIEARPGFDRRWNHHGDFYLVVPRQQERVLPPLSKKAPVAMLLLVGMIGLHVLEVMPLATAALAAALGMVAVGCLRIHEVRRAIDLPVMLTIAAAFGIGKAVETSGLAALMGHLASTAAPGMAPIYVLILLYLTTMALTEVITNNAAVVLMLPIALAAAAESAIPAHAAALTVTIAASASFLSPLGYHTNLMVMAAGGYRMRDYVRTGLPLSVGLFLITMSVIYLRWM